MSTSYEARNVSNYSERNFTMNWTHSATTKSFTVQRKYFQNDISMNQYQSIPHGKSGYHVLQPPDLDYSSEDRIQIAGLILGARRSEWQMGFQLFSATLSLNSCYFYWTSIELLNFLLQHFKDKATWHRLLSRYRQRPVIFTCHLFVVFIVDNANVGVEGCEWVGSHCWLRIGQGSQQRWFPSIGKAHLEYKHLLKPQF